MIPFTGSPLNRASEKRLDANWVAAKREDSSSRYIPLRRLEPLIVESIAAGTQLARFEPGQIGDIAEEGAICIFLGLDQDERAIFAIDALADAGSATGKFIEARAAAQMLPAGDAAILAQAKAMIDWHRRHGFCPNCGAPTQIMDAGYRRLCGKCNSEHFPRTDPVVIMLATYEDTCLVGRGKHFPPGMFSALAGFVEPGETIEEAVARELMEEAGLAVRDVTYHATQPWPFPSSLMIGCFARAVEQSARADDVELAEVKWLERRVARELIRGKRIDGVMTPPPIAIAHHLIKAWALAE